jgi:2-keto-4-pentenoate hydratase/2-oxohepta-3-ene-1,7-dioic acid hydratase in catechol pathway
VELGVVFGRAGKNIAAADAMKHVAGCVSSLSVPPAYS